jgi:secreted PhoX family phosphatase
MNRRDFLARSAHGGFAAFAALHLSRREGLSQVPSSPGYGPLRKAGPELALPEGFQYRVLGVEGTRMSDGRATPRMHDGMAAFALPGGNIRLIRNHEVGDHNEAGAAFGDTVLAYDPLAPGGTTSLEINPRTREVVRHFVSLSGTVLNCAGGPTPWGSWISCEETFAGPRQGYQQMHGYAFEVPVAAESQVKAEPLRALGRFYREAIAVDAATGIIYQTEDRPRSGLYRFVPEGAYRRGQRPNLSRGKLQMLAVAGRNQYDTAKNQKAGATLAVRWVDIATPEPTAADAQESDVFEQGWRAGGARFSRGEGCYYDRGDIYFTCTNAGDEGEGQVWRYRPPTGNASGNVSGGAGAGGELTLLYESPDDDVLSFPDNLCASPRGALVLCEDRNIGKCMLRGLTRDGRIFDFARNIANSSELAGSTFSPDGETLFVNIQSTGQTVAIWGPWNKGPL